METFKLLYIDSDKVVRRFFEHEFKDHSGYQLITLSSSENAPYTYQDFKPNLILVEGGLYLAHREDFAPLPEELLVLCGKREFVEKGKILAPKSQGLPSPYKAGDLLNKFSWMI